ncbi:MAG: type II secretion system F family protein [Desulfobacteraceae bacterium]
MTLSPYQLSIIICTATFLVLFLMSVGIIQYVRQASRRHEIVEKIKSGGESSGVLYGAGASKIDDKRGAGRSFANMLRAIGSRIAPSKSADYSKTRVKFLKAGIRRENVTALFWGAKLLLAVCLPLVFLMMRLTLFKLADMPLTLALAVAAGLAGYYLPDFLLQVRIARRRERIQKALPDALDLMVVCVEAGMGMDAAINRVAKEIRLTSPDLGEEFALLNLELRAGKARQDALRNLAVRTDIGAINSLVTLLIQTDKFGTSVASALRVFSDSFRTQRFQKAEEMAAKLPVKLIIPLIFFIFPSLFVVVVGPAAIKIYQNIIMR